MRKIFIKFASVLILVIYLLLHRVYTSSDDFDKSAHQLMRILVKAFATRRYDRYKCAGFHSHAEMYNFACGGMCSLSVYGTFSTI